MGTPFSSGSAQAGYDEAHARRMRATDEKFKAEIAKETDQELRENLEKYRGSMKNMSSTNYPGIRACRDLIRWTREEMERRGLK